MNRKQIRRLFIQLVFALGLTLISGAASIRQPAHADSQIGTQTGCSPIGLASRELSRCAYAERLRAMWLGEAIANWTGLTTEGVRQDAPFYTDQDWGIDQDLSWKMDDMIDFVLQDPWLADDDTDIEYVYLHLMDQHHSPMLSADQIASGWIAHINDWIWVSNQ